MIFLTDAIPVDEIQNWEQDDNVLIKAPPGTGKSYLCKRVLAPICRERGQRILYLLHRKDTIEAFKKELKREKLTDVISLRTYQSIGQIELKSATTGHFSFNQYACIVADEFHMAISDASFNDCTDLVMAAINRASALKVFISATADRTVDYLQKQGVKFSRKYIIPDDFSQIGQLTFYYSDAVENEIIQEVLIRKEKAVVFIKSAERAYKLSKQFGDKALFNCSRSNKPYGKKVDRDAVSKVLETYKLDRPLLITTTTMDAGLDIIDADVRTVIADIDDIDTLIQAINRKRVRYEDADGHLIEESPFNVYVRSLKNQQLGGKKKQLEDKLKMADFLRGHTTAEFLQKYPRKHDKDGVVYPDQADDGVHAIFKINETRYAKIKADLQTVDEMLALGKDGHRMYVSKLLKQIDSVTGRYKSKVRYSSNSLIETWLLANVNKIMLAQKDREEFITIMDVRSRGKRLKKNIDAMNGALAERGLSFKVIEFYTECKVNGKRIQYRHAWQIKKLKSKVCDKKGRKLYIVHPTKNVTSFFYYKKRG